MSVFRARRTGPVRWPPATWPALGALAFGLAVVLVRPPIPIDETRYLEVFHESLRGNPLLLRLLGEPYAEKPPLLFWVARLLTWLAVPPDVALRCVPPLAAAATVLVVGRLGQRLGLGLAGWLQAVLWIGSLSAQFLHFDPLVTLAVWAAMDAWVRRSAAGFTLWSAAALLAKGPVAYLFLIPLAWSLSPLREWRAGDTARAARALALALVPLAAWAIAAATLGGEDFARALLWDRWAGRVASSAPHARPLYFYLPIVLVGSLPATPLLFRRAGRLDEGGAREWSRRLGRTLVAILLLFTLIRGKQAHYLEPAVPGLALWLAWRIESRPEELAPLRLGIRAHVSLFLCMAVVGALFLPRAAPSVGTHGRDLLDGGGFALPLALTAGIALLALASTWTARLGARGLLVIGFLGVSLAALPLHWLGGELLFPHRLADALQSGPEKVAYLGSSHHGVYALLSPSPEVEKLDDALELGSWSERNPDSLVVADSKALGEEVPRGLVVVARDVVHRTPVLVLRRGS
jgi:4-amino-4-deoxy-L-arabinose transferase-like glycosyltransferase